MRWQMNESQRCDGKINENISPFNSRLVFFSLVRTSAILIVRKKTFCYCPIIFINSKWPDSILPPFSKTDPTIYGQPFFVHSFTCGRWQRRWRQQCWPVFVFLIHRIGINVNPIGRPMRRCSMFEDIAQILYQHLFAFFLSFVRSFFSPFLLPSHCPVKWMAEKPMSPVQHALPVENNNLVLLTPNFNGIISISFRPMMTFANGRVTKTEESINFYLLYYGIVFRAIFVSIETRKNVTFWLNFDCEVVIQCDYVILNENELKINLEK